MTVIVGLWPVGAIFAAVLLRLLADEIRGRDVFHARIPMRDRFLLELLTVASLAFIVAAGVGFGITWTPFR